MATAGSALGAAIATAVQGLFPNITANQLASLQQAWQPIAGAFVNNYVSNWQAYTPVLGSWGTTNVTPTGQWRRVGDSIECKVHIAVTGAPSGSLTTVSLPVVNGVQLTIDTTKLPAAVNNRGAYGYGNMICAGGGNYILQILYQGTTAVRPSYNTTGTAAANAPLPDAGISATAPATFQSGDSIDIFFAVPVTQFAL